MPDALPQHGVIDEYIAACDPKFQPKLNEIRDLIRATAPEASEKIGYGMPTFVLSGNLVHFAAQAGHLGFYPAPSGVLEFLRLVPDAVTSKGAVQLPWDEPLPTDVIRAVVEFRMAENLAKKK